MEFDTEKYNRHYVRLNEYDYSREGAYFVTICTRNRALFFEKEGVRVIAEKCWAELPDHFPIVQLDQWVIMPNHVHGIITIVADCRGVQLNAPTQKPVIRDHNNCFSAISPPSNTLAVIVRTYKAAVTILYRRAGYRNFGWQRDYYEHGVRTAEELNRVR